MKLLIILTLLVSSTLSFAESISCYNKKRKERTLEIESINTSRNLWEVRFYNYGKEEYRGDAYISKNQKIGDGEIVIKTVELAEGEFTHGPFPAMSISLSGDGFNGSFRAEAESVSQKISNGLFRGEQPSFWCKLNN